MSADSEMRSRLQQVAAYRELCRGVRRSGRGNVVFGGLMLLVGYLIYQQAPAGAGIPVGLIVIGVLFLGELLAGLYKWLAPSAEGILLDSLVILVFAGYNLFIQYKQFQGGGRIEPFFVLLGLFMLMNAINGFQSYGQLRKLFAERPSAEHMAWFDELVREIRAADPQSDELALDLPTRPHWKAKLFGTTAFFVGVRDGAVWVAGPGDFELLREKTDRGTGRRKALFQIHSYPYPEFEVTDATWANYTKWRAAFPPAPAAPTGTP